ncbi:MAG: type II toxin-antitoxin system HicB family antitoxin [Candidatus Eremiobacterota bacterium]
MNNTSITKIVEVNNKNYEVILHPDPEDGGFFVECPELDCVSQGDNEEEATWMIKDSIEGHLEILQNRKLTCI